MNVRAFVSEQELYEALVSWADRLFRTVVQPHVGIIAGYPASVAALAALASPGARFAIHPQALVDSITEAGRILADSRDLNEPLDLLIIAGPPPASEPPWGGHPRHVAIVAKEEADLKQWLAQQPDTRTERGWFFVLEQQWNALRPPQNRTKGREDLEQ